MTIGAPYGLALKHAAWSGDTEQDVATLVPNATKIWGVSSTVGNVDLYYDRGGDDAHVLRAGPLSTLPFGQGFALPPVSVDNGGTRRLLKAKNDTVTTGRSVIWYEE